MLLSQVTERNIDNLQKKKRERNEKDYLAFERWRNLRCPLTF